MSALFSIFHASFPRKPLLSAGFQQDGVSLPECQSREILMPGLFCASFTCLRQPTLLTASPLWCSVKSMLTLHRVDCIGVMGIAKISLQRSFNSQQRNRWEELLFPKIHLWWCLVPTSPLGKRDPSSVAFCKCQIEIRTITTSLCQNLSVLIFRS